MSPPDVETSAASPRERVLAAAYDLFSQRGIRAVGTDEVIGRAGVARATLYRHFATKDDLVLAVLQRREEIWTHGLIEEQSRQRGDTPEERLLAMFDVMHEWFQLHDRYEGCSFINVLLELGPEHPIGKACIGHIEHVRDIVRGRAMAAGLTDVEDFASSWHILMKGAIILAAVGDRDAALRARKMARLLIDEHRPPLAVDTGEAV
ncbi:TetR/AcrR family transcriptional regulator [Mycobacterium arosiense]|uniref:TetR family transcriptional regulator n=1 Tax=Mycobacterium arosiense ATCC BAA-1401 = DSM 45069 TaxID=1265311 RepID=A0A1W9ZGB9_MYCAI|nr:TetR/AcrR family transcriptional regulator [Mycobacterium arosiense]ORA14821.1 TetR family transcriptional regulator [Mycobacterium arosiense ATCC BAA-1401 = DSM 45069]